MWIPRALKHLKYDFRALGNLKLQYRIARRSMRSPLPWIFGAGLIAFEEYSTGAGGRLLERNSFEIRKQYVFEEVVSEMVESEQFYEDISEVYKPPEDQTYFLVLNPPDPVTEEHRRRVITNMNAAVAFALEHQINVRWRCDSASQRSYFFGGGWLPQHRSHIALANGYLLAESPAEFGFTLKHELGHKKQNLAVNTLHTFLTLVHVPIAVTLRMSILLPYLTVGHYALWPAVAYIAGCVRERHADWYARRHSTSEELVFARKRFLKQLETCKFEDWDVHPRHELRIAAIERELTRRGVAFTKQDGSAPSSANDPTDS